MCPPGMRPDVPGLTGKCVSCLPGWYKSTYSADLCKQCPLGSYAVRNVGLTTIDDCRGDCFIYCASCVIIDSMYK